MRGESAEWRNGTRRLAAALALTAFAAAFAAAADGVVPQPADPPLWSAEDYNGGVAATGADRLHAIGILGQGLTTAIVDAGFYTGHEIFNDVNIVNAYDGGAHDHGTHVAGTVLAMAPATGLWLGTYGGENDPKSLGVDSFLAIGECAGAYNIVAVNNSWGHPLKGMYVDSDEVVENHPEIAAATAILLDAGIAVVASSGNSGINDRTGSPYGLPGVLAVGALEPSGHIAAFSNLQRKDGLFVVAPGVDICSADSTDEEGGNHYSVKAGTSMASPHVAGAITLLKSGARMASADEIIAAIVDTADRIPYDGNAILDKYSVTAHDPRGALDLISVLPGDEDISRYTDWLDDAIAKYDDNTLTMDSWRIINQIWSNANLCVSDDGGTFFSRAAFIGIMESTGDLNPLRYTEYGFLRVDKAFMELTRSRTEKIAGELRATDHGLARVLSAYAGELAADINAHTAGVFQRLDALAPGKQLAVARKMSPRFAADTVHSAHLGLVGTHRALGARTELHRLEEAFPGFRDPVAIASAADTAIDGTGGGVCGCHGERFCAGDGGLDFTAWAEGFGRGFDRETPASGRSAGYDGHFAGGTLGLELNRDRWTFGALVQGADHRVRSADGRAGGSWFAFGLHGRRDWTRGFVEASALYGAGDYDMKRYVHVPGAVFTGAGPGEYVFDWAGDIHGRAGSSHDMRNLSLRLAGGFDFARGGGWVFGLRGETTLSHMRTDAYTERGGQSFNLRVNRHETVYVEGGAGLVVGRVFGCDRPRFALTGKVMGMAGGIVGGGDMYGRFTQYGSTFRYDPDHRVRGWVAPEMNLSWHISERAVLTGSYNGRISNSYSEHGGSLDLEVRW